MIKKKSNIGYVQSVIDKILKVRNFAKIQSVLFIEKDGGIGRKLANLIKILSACSFFLIFSTCTSFPSSVNQKKVNAEKFISSLPAEEKFLLEHFFRCLIQEDAIGYSLIHSKPMSFFSYLQPKALSISPYEIAPINKMDLFIDGFNPQNAVFHKGFEIWKKYQHLYCGNNIVFDFYADEEELSFRKVIVFNRKLLLPLFEKHISRFQQIDSSLKDSESIFNALRNDERFKKKFYCSTALVGICLGYGERNAVLFEKMIRYFTALGFYGFTLQSLEHQKAIKNDLAVLNASFNGVLNSHHSKRMLFSFGPSFRVDKEHAETLLLKEKYTEASKALVHFYDNEKSFLENTLHLLIEENN